MRDCEAIIIAGAEQISDYTGYSRTFKITNEHYDNRPRDSRNRVSHYQCAIDALCVKRFPKKQYTRGQIIRELNKAYVGFQGEDEEKFPEGKQYPICTGKWGCGAFGGDCQLKAVIQWISASAANRDMIFCSFGDSALSRFNEVIATLKQLTIGQLVKQVVAICENKRKDVSLFEILLDTTLRRSVLTNARIGPGRQQRAEAEHNENPVQNKKSAACKCVLS